VFSAHALFVNWGTFICLQVFMTLCAIFALRYRLRFVSLTLANTEVCLYSCIEHQYYVSSLVNIERIIVGDSASYLFFNWVVIVLLLFIVYPLLLFICKQQNFIFCEWIWRSVSNAKPWKNKYVWIICAAILRMQILPCACIVTPLDSCFSQVTECETNILCCVIIAESLAYGSVFNSDKNPVMKLYRLPSENLFATLFASSSSS
jgi:hypothetical protein